MSEEINDKDAFNCIRESVHQMFDNCGYRKFNSNFHSTVDKDNSYICSYQKCIQDNNGKKYFIDIHLHKNTIKFENPIGLIVFDIESQLKNKAGTFDVNYLIKPDSEATLKDIEEFYEDIWKRMACSYYD